jgi:hypothetical protein
MNLDPQVYKRLYSDDIIYHYTKASTAIDFILFNKKLKFGKQKNSNDPIESCNARRSIAWYNNGGECSNDLELTNDCNEVNNYISNRENNFYQISFCKNHQDELIDTIDGFCQFEGLEELFGFSKPRMWDQYADKYRGVCIAFSKKKILSANKAIVDINYCDDVNYLKYNEISSIKVGDIDGHYLAKVGKEVSKVDIEDRLRSSFFCKHQDYKDENEYRIGTFYDKEKCYFEIDKDKWVSDRTMMLDISDCIEAIFVSSYANDKQKNSLREYANQLKKPIIEMVWRHDSFEPRDYEDYMIFIEKNVLSIKG